MLVLTRKSEEKITIGKKKEIVITILKIRGETVSIGIKAPKDCPIYRNELIEEDILEVVLEADSDHELSAKCHIAVEENQNAIAPVA